MEEQWKKINNIPTLNYSISNLGKVRNEKHAFANHLKRPTRGELSGMAKLTYQQVKEIRKKYSTGNKKKYSTRKLAKEYNVGKSTILYIVQGKTWKDGKEVK